MKKEKKKEEEENNERNELHLLYRPQNFDEYIGNPLLIEVIKDNLNRTRTFLLSGLRGCGKTTIGRLIAYEQGVSDLDIKEIDGASERGIDDARKIKREARYLPMKGKFKIYIIDECHRLTGDAFDSLLKTLEEPPLHCIFVLCTTEINKVPTTIKSRAKIFEVKPLMRKDALKLIDWICENENIKLGDEVKNKIISNCEGIPREIVISIDLIRNLKKEDDQISVLNNYSSVNPNTLELCKALLNNMKWMQLKEIVKEIKEEPERVRYGVLTYMSKVLLDKDSQRAADLIVFFSETFIYTGRAGLVLSCYQSTK